MIWEHFLIGILSAGVSTVGFSMLFDMKLRHIPASGLGGVLSYGIYLLLGSVMEGEFFPCFLASVITAFYAEVCAHLLKAPVQVYMITALVPLFPGGALYYTMYELLAQDYVEAFRQGIITIETTFGIAGGITIGIAIASSMFWLIRKGNLPHPTVDQDASSTEKET